MDNKDIQRLLAAAGYYKGPIDGVINEDEERVVTLILKRHELISEVTPLDSLKRQLVAAGQLILHFAGHSPGPIDGYAGNQTNGALLAWDHAQAYGMPLELSKTQIRIPPDAANRWPTQAECIEFYGTPGVGESAEANLVRVEVPYRVIIEYDPTKTRKTLNLHRKCAESYSKIMHDVLQVYGDKKIQELGLNQFAGDYVPRRMRGGKSWSMHAFGCAIDWDANRNGLTTRAPYAQFSKPDYKDFLDIHESHGWVSLGRAIGRDYMHFQAARL